MVSVILISGECKIKNFSDSDWKVFKKLDLNDNDAEKTIFTAEYSDELGK